MSGANQGMTEDEVRNYILRRLGAGIVDVELTKEQVDDILQDARRWFVNRIGVDIFHEIQVVRGTPQYILPGHVVDVYDVWLPEGSFASVTGFGDFADSFLFGLWFSQGALSGGAGFGSSGRAEGQDQYPYSNLLQTLQFLETSRRLWGADSDWDFNKRTRALTIMPGPPRSGTAFVQVNSTMFDTTKLDPEEEDLFLRWSVALAKEQLGRNRSKYDTVPTVGGDRNLDGDRLLTEAQTEMETISRQVLDRIAAYGRFIVTG